MTGLEKAIKAKGSRGKLAKAIGLSRAAVYKWQRIPAERVVDVEKATGIPREKLRPDLHEMRRQK